MSAAQQLAKFQLINVHDLIESPLNPRKEFNQAKLDELTASVRERGVLEPLLVRPTETGFEVAAGARRYRAAVAADLATVPCLVREMTDVELLEVALLENVVRADLTALEEGDAYAALVGQHGYTVEQLAEKTGKSRTVVFARMKLASLQGPARELVLSGQWNASIGELIARLPTEKAQAAAMKRLEERRKYDEDGVAGITFRDAKDLLDEEFKLQLKDATFDVKDPMLVPEASACGLCPKRTHAPDNKGQFDVREDTCLDEACWNKKKSASFKQLQAELAADGKKLVKEKNLLTQNYYGEKSTLTAAAAEKYSKPADEVLGEKTWKDLLGADVPKVVVLDAENKTHNLVDRKAALAKLEEKDPKLAAKLKEQKPAKKEDDWEAKRAAENKKHEARRAAVRVVRAKAVEKVTKLETAVELLLLSYSRSWQWSETLKNAGLPKGSKPGQLKPAQRVQFLVGLALSSNGEDAAVEAAAKLVKVDLKALTKKALAATEGTCFACSKPAGEKAILCEACVGEVD